MDSPGGIITTSTRALVAVVATASIAAYSLYTTLNSHPSLLEPLNHGIQLSHLFKAAVVITGCGIILVAIVYASTPARMAEKLMWLAILAGQLVLPVAYLDPNAIRYARPLGSALKFMAFVAASFQLRAIAKDRSSTTMR